jgi:hypothetical protein
MNRLERMKLAINDAELAIGEVVELAEKFAGASDEILIKVPLHIIRQLANCYPALNALMNEKI